MENRYVDVFYRQVIGTDGKPAFQQVSKEEAMKNMKCS
jgi:hypothetical protein